MVKVIVGYISCSISTPVGRSFSCNTTSRRVNDACVCRFASAPPNRLLKRAPLLAPLGEHGPGFWRNDSKGLISGNIPATSEQHFCQQTFLKSIQSTTDSFGWFFAFSACSCSFAQRSKVVLVNLSKPTKYNVWKQTFLEKKSPNVECASTFPRPTDNVSFPWRWTPAAKIDPLSERKCNTESIYKERAQMEPAWIDGRVTKLLCKLTTWKSV